jgi:hypothetical protein
LPGVWWPPPLNATRSHMAETQTKIARAQQCIWQEANENRKHRIRKKRRIHNSAHNKREMIINTKHVLLKGIIIIVLLKAARNTLCFLHYLATLYHIQWPVLIWEVRSGRIIMIGELGQMPLIWRYYTDISQEELRKPLGYLNKSS